MKPLDFFEREIQKLDISPTNYNLAVARYKAVGKSIEEYIREKFGLDVHIYPQGSFRIGTVTYPADRDDGYDIDLVCEVQQPKYKITPESLKEMIGEALKSDVVYGDMLDDEGRRCWTVKYKEQNGLRFHIDILPSVPEMIDSTIDTSIATTTRIKENNQIKGYVWDTTNPIAYALWFEEINQKSYENVQAKYRNLLFETNKHIYSSIDEVPKELIKTKLQKIIQIFKRHRDIRFMNSELKNAKPMSMIITTLVSEVYRYINVEDEDIITTMKKVIIELSRYKILTNNETSVSNRFDT